MSSFKTSQRLPGTQLLIDAFPLHLRQNYTKVPYTCIWKIRHIKWWMIATNDVVLTQLKRVKIDVLTSAISIHKVPFQRV